MDLPELQAIRLGYAALSFIPQGESDSSLFMKGSLVSSLLFVDLPKLTTITTTKEVIDDMQSTSLGLPQRVYLESCFLLEL